MLVGALIATAGLSALAGWSLRPSAVRPVTRFAHVLGGDESFTQTVRPLVAIAPDGSSIVFPAGNQLYRRRLGDLDAMPIRGTDGALSTPFFSPHGETLGFWDSAADEVRTVAISGGTPVRLAGASSFYGASWGDDGSIVYGQEDGIWRVDARGGSPERIVEIDNAPTDAPEFLPMARVWRWKS